MHAKSDAWICLSFLMYFICIATGHYRTVGGEKSHNKVMHFRDIMLNTPRNKLKK